MTEHGIFHWNELNTRDVEKAKAFYEKAIGWTFDGMPMQNGTYWVAKVGDKMVGGIFDTNDGLRNGNSRALALLSCRSTMSTSAARSRRRQAPRSSASRSTYRGPVVSQSLRNPAEPLSA